MANDLGFYLRTCEGMPDSLWQTASTIIDSNLKICWKAFPLFLSIRIISDVAMERYHGGNMSLRNHIKSIFDAIIITFALLEYKFILEFFDEFIHALCVHSSEVGMVAKKIVNEQNSKRSWYGTIGYLIKYFFDSFPNLLSVFSHTGAIIFMHYIKIIHLIIAAILGPYAIIFSLLPGPFKRGVLSWIKSYVNLTCWAITLSIFANISTAMLVFSTASDGFSATIGHTFFLLILLICIFSTPTITSQFIGGAIIPSIGPGLNVIGRTFSRLGGTKLVSNMVGGAFRRMGNLAGRFSKMR